MQENIGIASARPALQCAPSRQKTTFTTLSAGLSNLGFSLPALGDKHCVAGGVTVKYAVSPLLRSPALLESAVQSVCTLLAEQIPVMLTLTELNEKKNAITELNERKDAIQTLREFCERLRASVKSLGLSPDGLGLCIRSHQMPLQAYMLISRSILGDGPRYVLLDSLQMNHHRDTRVQNATDNNWSFLWRSLGSRNELLPAYGATVRTTCSLLSNEAADSLLPAGGIQVPEQSAWLSMELPLPLFADDSGRIRWADLSLALAGGVEIAEQMLDCVSWATDQQCHDAHLNRRLAISVTGLGDLVKRRGSDPASFATLSWLSTIVVRIRNELRQKTRLMAREKLPPVLTQGDPLADWKEGAARDKWLHYWSQALSESAVRHRNMLVLSPYSVLPQNGDCSVSYTDLLPVIATADAWSFIGAQPLRHWNVNDFKNFHRRAWAVMQDSDRRTLIAATV